jgi:hypothetical protein
VGIGLYFLCVVGCYYWQMKGFKLEYEAWQSNDREEYSKLEVDYYLKRFETERRQMWLWSFVGGAYLWAPFIYLFSDLSNRK